MLLAIWWTWQRLLWTILPLPQNLREREIVIADRAAMVLDRHLAAIRSQSYKLDPYATKAPKFRRSAPCDGSCRSRALMSMEAWR
jgi:hypothetical protein